MSGQREPSVEGFGYRQEPRRSLSFADLLIYADGSDARHGRRRARLVRGPLRAGARRARRQPRHPGDARRGDGMARPGPWRTPTGWPRSTWSAGSPAHFALDRLDAYQIVAQAAQAPVAQVCNPIYTVTSKIAKGLLPAEPFYNGAHARLRDQAAAYRSEL